MKTSYFNPEVHSLTFMNFKHVVCGRSWGYQCGGMCCMVLKRFYKGELIDCESLRNGYEDDIWNLQVGIIGSDIYKSCRWGRSMDAIDKISENIDIGKPTLLYLDLKDYDLVNDHFVVAYAIREISNHLKLIYIYDPNYIYKRHYCADPNKIYCVDPANPNSTLKNFESYLEVNYNNETVTLNNGSDQVPVLGFKWYGQDETGIPVSYYTGEKSIEHSCDLTLISKNPPELINNKPLISYTIRISKEGDVPADLKLWWEGDQDLYESGDNLFPDGLKSNFSHYVKHKGLQSGKGYIEKTYKVYQNFAISNPATILLKSNFVEKRLQLAFDKPAIETFTAFMEGTTPQRRHYYADSVDNQIIRLQGLNRNNVHEVEKVPEGYKEELPVNHVSFSFIGEDWQSAVNSGAYSLFEPVFYLGYINSNVDIELTHNGLYTGATVKMTSNDPPPIENPFVGNAVTFTLPGGNQGYYNSNVLNNLVFAVKGGGISAGFSETFSAILQYRCLILHEPLFHKRDIRDLDVFARYFEKLLINIPHSQRIPQLEDRFSRELEKHPGMDREKFKQIFCDQLISRFVSKSKTFWNYRSIHKNFIASFHSHDSYRKERVEFILNKSKDLQALKQNFAILEDQMRPLIGKALVAKRPFIRVVTNVLKREWK